jgi:hypothetical protein
MNDTLLRDAERLKLARVLGVEPGALAFLDGADTAALRALREASTEYLFHQHHGLFQKIAASGRLVPAVITAKLSESVFGPMISARVAGLLPPERAVEVATRLPAEFLADLSLELDPASAPEVVRRMPITIVVSVAKVLCRRREYITMARFVDNLAETAIRAVVTQALDDEALARTGFYVESEPHLNQVVGLLPPERLQGTVRVTTEGPPELQQAGVVLLCRVHNPLKGRMGDAAAEQGESLLQRVIRNLHDARQAAAARAMVEHMHERHRPMAARLL